jgi:hypothetical protein
MESGGQTLVDLGRLGERFGERASRLCAESDARTLRKDLLGSCCRGLQHERRDVQVCGGGRSLEQRLVDGADANLETVILRSRHVLTMAVRSTDVKRAARLATAAFVDTVVKADRLRSRP